MDDLLGIDRTCFSNLFVDTVPLHITVTEENADLFRHRFLGEVPGCSSESFFQAAKCQEEADARFMMLNLNSMQVAQYGQRRLTLDEAQVEALVALGIDRESGFQAVDGGW